MKQPILPLTTTTDSEEVVNFYTHGLGLLLSLVAVFMLINHASSEGMPVLGYWVFGLSAIILYAASTLYHGVQKVKTKYWLQKVDHICIYFLIAGTNTPFALLYLEEPTQSYYLFCLWGLVGVGVIYKIFFFGRWKLFSTFYYILLGWMAAFVMPEMLESMPSICFWWIIGGGLSYSVGVVFYAWRRLPYNHAIWHLLVIGGTFGHYMAIWKTI